MSGTVQGLKNITKAVELHKKVTAAGLRTGLMRAGLFLQRESQKIVPVDTGALRASANTRLEGTDKDLAVIVSYSQEYAIFVHENLESRHKPGKTAKYLEKPAREKRGAMEDIVIKAIKEAQ